MSTVQDILNIVEHVWEGHNTYPSLNRSLRLVAQRLMWHKSDMQVTKMTVSFTADSSSASLPSDFWGLAGRPYIDGKTWPLLPVPNKDTHLDWSGYGVPQFYEILESTLYLIPGTSSAIDVKGDYFFCPATVDSADDTIPWGGLFDDAVAEYMKEADKINPIPETVIQGTVWAMVDQLVPKRNRKAPKRPRRGINYRRHW